MMLSKGRIDAGRRNGTLAIGKKSEEARQKCVKNSRKHGLLSKTSVLANESPELFESTRKSYYELWKPKNEFEADLVNDMVAARWRLNRVMGGETETLALGQARMAHSGELKKEFEIIPERTRIAIVFEKEMNESKTLANLSRYEVRYPRQLRQATAELRRIKEDRRADEAEAAEETIKREPQPIRKNEGNEPPRSSLNILQNMILPNEGNEVARSLLAILQNEGNGTPLIWIHYSYQRASIVDHAKIPPTGLANFPVLISGTYAYLFRDARFETELEPYITHRTPIWDRNTLNMWIDACWPEEPPFVSTKSPSRYNLRR
jgi:hypothetical protein